MNGAPTIVPMMQEPTAEQAERALREARRRYRRVLSCWASELLELRRAGLDGARWHGSHGHPLELAA